MKDVKFLKGEKWREKKRKTRKSGSAQIKAYVNGCMGEEKKKENYKKISQGHKHDFPN